MKQPFGPSSLDGIFRKNRSRNDYEEREQLSVGVIEDKERLIELESKRVRWYLDDYNWYKEKGYRLRFPEGIDPEKAPTISDSDIAIAVEKEVGLGFDDYQSYIDELKETWERISERVINVAEDVYGFVPFGHFQLAPTAYGTGGGALEEDGPIFFRLSKHRPTSKVTEEEAVIHEVLAHEATAHLRNGGPLEDSTTATHHWHKERLMDLLGRTLLVRSGILKSDEVCMVGMDPSEERKIAEDIDSLYYKNPNKPDENELRYEGRLEELIKEIERKIASK